ncbi:nucleotide-diphospho-sugar transferase [Hysterangium stoloniferum]|nr:nucleotide-diphospho-sugar transferase [Hysterangium stoloniferum]
MPPKNSIGGGNMPSEDDEPLQAVILADTYNERLKPLTATQPRCLLPICNTALLDWTLESLSLAGVQEVFVVCTSHADLIKETIAASKWSLPAAGLKITPIATDPACFAPGEALRDVYTHGVITSDFVLVFGDLVSNVRLDEVVRAHKARRKVDKEAIMTMVVKEAGREGRSRPLGDTGVFVLDAETDECLHYEVVAGMPLKKNVKIPREVFAKGRQVDVRNDLIDCGIDICSVDVPSLFQDNFDYLDIRRDFVHGILTSDLLTKTIHCHIVKDGYAARVKDSKSYDVISKDILSRWTYPLVPDENNPNGQLYEHRRGNVYLPSGGTSVQLSCKIGPNTLLGPSTTVAASTTISSSVIGANCTIGANVTVRNSYIWDGAVIEDKCTVERSIVGKGVKMGKGSILLKGCLVGDGVKLGKGTRLEEFTRVGGEKPEEGGEKLVGEGSEGFLWPTIGDSCVRNSEVHSDDEDEDEEVRDELETPQNLRFLRIGGHLHILVATYLMTFHTGDETRLEDVQRYEADSSSSSEDESRDGDSDQDDDDDTASNASTHSSAPSAPLGSKLTSIANAEFQSEVTASLSRAWEEGHSVDNAAVELKTLRMASNVPLIRVREAIISFLVEKIDTGGEGDARERVKKAVGRWGGLIDAIGGVDKVETVQVLQWVCAAETRYQSLFGLLLGAFYQADIIEEEDIREWHGNALNRGSVGMEKCWSIGSRMIEQFDAQESEEDSD